MSISGGSSLNALLECITQFSFSQKESSLHVLIPLSALSDDLWEVSFKGVALIINCSLVH